MVFTYNFSAKVFTTFPKFLIVVTNVCTYGSQGNGQDHGPVFLGMQFGEMGDPESKSATGGSIQAASRIPRLISILNELREQVDDSNHRFQAHFRFFSNEGTIRSRLQG